MEKLPRYLVTALSQEPWYFLYVKRAVTKNVKCTFCYSPAQISGLAQKANVILMSPQWGNNSKAMYSGIEAFNAMSFSPRNGEIILKYY